MMIEDHDKINAMECQVKIMLEYNMDRTMFYSC